MSDNTHDANDMSLIAEDFVIVWTCNNNQLTSSNFTNNHTLAITSSNANNNNIRLDTVPICAKDIFYAILPIMLSIVTVFGNTVVLLAVALNEKLRNKQTSLLIGNLAVADLLVGLLVMPFSAINLVTSRQWLFSNWLCHMWIGMDVICCTASIVTLTVISIDRFIGVTKPLQYSRLVTREKVLSANAGVWIFSIFTLLVTIDWIKSKDTNRYSSLVCDVSLELRHVTLSTIFSFYVPALVILCVYMKIYRVTQNRFTQLLYTAQMPFTEKNSTGSNSQRQLNRVRTIRNKIGRTLGTTRRKKRRHSVDSNATSMLGSPTGTCGEGSTSGYVSSNGKSSALTINGTVPAQSTTTTPTTLRVHYGRSNQYSGTGQGINKQAVEMRRQRQTYMRQKKSAKTLGLVVGAFFICWLPFFVAHLINNLFTSPIVPDLVMDLFTWLGYCNSACNPVIYTLTMKSFSDTFRNILTKHVMPRFVRVRRACTPTSLAAEVTINSLNHASSNSQSAGQITTATTKLRSVKSSTLHACRIKSRAMLASGRHSNGRLPESPMQAQALLSPRAPTRRYSAEQNSVPQLRVTDVSQDNEEPQFSIGTNYPIPMYEVRRHASSLAMVPESARLSDEERDSSPDLGRKSHRILSKQTSTIFEEQSIPNSSATASPQVSLKSQQKNKPASAKCLINTDNSPGPGPRDSEQPLLLKGERSGSSSVKHSPSWMTLKLYQMLVSSKATDL